MTIAELSQFGLKKIHNDDYTCNLNIVFTNALK